MGARGILWEPAIAGDPAAAGQADAGTHRR
jgi:hypothetical protein